MAKKAKPERGDYTVVNEPQDVQLSPRQIEQAKCFAEQVADFRRKGEKELADAAALGLRTYANANSVAYSMEVGALSVPLSPPPPTIPPEFQTRELTADEVVRFAEIETSNAARSIRAAGLRHDRRGKLYVCHLADFKEKYHEQLKPKRG